MDVSNIKRIENHGTVTVLWLDDQGVESLAYLDHRGFQKLIDDYRETLAEDEFVYEGRVIWTNSASSMVSVNCIRYSIRGVDLRSSTITSASIPGAWRSIRALPPFIRMARFCASFKNASTDSGCTVQKTAALVVPLRNSSSKKWRAACRA